eukprot:TRINITY_DN3618_c0_g1_i1.p1 TRINITY_DN3618_c0_g1~~TRINITY_DN3618_c0_g1_i1.p1  ORF type:complete len:89 (-),score=24.85 TRINITY_DN3618_c0_g1_i1:280-546(-)
MKNKRTKRKKEREDVALAMLGSFKKQLKKTIKESDKGDSSGDRVADKNASATAATLALVDGGSDEEFDPDWMGNGTLRFTKRPTGLSG